MRISASPASTIIIRMRSLVSLRRANQRQEDSVLRGCSRPCRRRPRRGVPARLFGRCAHHPELFGRRRAERSVDPEATRRKGVLIGIASDVHWRSLFHPRLWAQLRCVRSCDRCRDLEAGPSARSRMAARFLHRPCRRRGRRRCASVLPERAAIFAAGFTVLLVRIWAARSPAHLCRCDAWTICPAGGRFGVRLAALSRSRLRQHPVEPAQPECPARQPRRAQEGARRCAHSELRGNRRHLAAEQRKAADRPDRLASQSRLSRNAYCTRATPESSPGSKIPNSHSAITSRRSTRCSATRRESPACQWTFRSRSASRSAAADPSPIDWPARSWLPTRPHMTASNGNITTPKRSKMPLGSYRC